MKLAAKLGSLPSVVGSADSAPTQQATAVFEYASGLVDEQLAAWHDIIINDLAAFNSALREAEVPAVVVSAFGRSG